MRARVVAIALVACGALTGCQAPGTPAAHHDSASGAAQPTTSPPPATFTPTAPASSPLGAGERVWAAFSQRGLSQDAWWARLKPLLSDSAQAVYVYDDPRNLPAMTVNGKIQLAAKAPDQPRFTAEVVVPTSKGVFQLDLERHTVKSPWLLYAIKFPAGVQ